MSTAGLKAGAKVISGAVRKPRLSPARIALIAVVAVFLIAVLRLVTGANDLASSGALAAAIGDLPKDVPRAPQRGLGVLMRVGVLEEIGGVRRGHIAVAVGLHEPLVQQGVHEGLEDAAVAVGLGEELTVTDPLLDALPPGATGLADQLHDRALNPPGALHKDTTARLGTRKHVVCRSQP